MDDFGVIPNFQNRQISYSLVFKIKLYEFNLNKICSSYSENKCCTVGRATLYVHMPGKINAHAVITILIDILK